MKFHGQAQTRYASWTAVWSPFTTITLFAISFCGDLARVSKKRSINMNFSLSCLQAVASTYVSAVEEEPSFSTTPNPKNLLRLDSVPSRRRCFTFDGTPARDRNLYAKYTSYCLLPGRCSSTGDFKQDIHPQFCRNSPLLLSLPSRSVDTWLGFPLPRQSMLGVRLGSQGGRKQIRPIAGGLYVKEAMTAS
jgi:hypothetical protein